MPARDVQCVLHMYVKKKNTKSFISNFRPTDGRSSAHFSWHVPPRTTTPAESHPPAPDTPPTPRAMIRAERGLNSSLLDTSLTLPNAGSHQSCAGARAPRNFRCVRFIPVQNIIILYRNNPRPTFPPIRTTWRRLFSGTLHARFCRRGRSAVVQPGSSPFRWWP